uniref:DUF3615 domain-containing protein n=2 Tax=Oryza sativa subsp. japonica TaxID=39947 RepID=A0A5S6R783_ORYSJ|nr:Unknown protein [Oryza sativa]ABB46633.2 hypothetical protein LOC_Os10g02740 [Oryza sativa Japonica Group]
MATIDITAAHTKIKLTKFWNPIQPPATVLNLNGRQICIRAMFSVRIRVTTSCNVTSKASICSIAIVERRDGGWTATRACAELSQGESRQKHNRWASMVKLLRYTHVNFLATQKTDSLSFPVLFFAEFDNEKTEGEPPVFCCKVDMQLPCADNLESMCVKNIGNVEYNTTKHLMTFKFTPNKVVFTS